MRSVGGTAFVALTTFVGAGCGRIGFDTIDESLPAHVQTVAPNFVTTSQLTAMISVGAGNTLVAATFWDTTANTITVSDSGGLTWTALAALDNSACFAAPKATGAQIWFAQTKSAGTLTVTVTQSDLMNHPLGLRLLEYANLGGLDVAAARNAPSASNEMSPGTLVTTAPAVTVAIFNNTNGNGTMTPGAGWTERAIEVPFYTLVEDNIPGAPPGPIAPLANQPATVNEACWVAAAAAFRVAG